MATRIVRIDPKFARLAERIDRGDVGHEDLVDLILGGLVGAGMATPPRADLLAQVQRMYPTKENVQDFLREQVQGYIAYMAEQAEYEH